jgi:hypothetical protein
MKKHTQTFGVTGDKIVIDCFAELAVKDGWELNKEGHNPFVEKSLSFAGKLFNEDNHQGIKIGQFFYCTISDEPSIPVINIDTPEGFSKALTLMQEVEEEQLYGECVEGAHLLIEGKIYPLDRGEYSNYYQVNYLDDKGSGSYHKSRFKLVPESEYLAQQERESQMKQLQEFGWLGPSGAGKNAADTVKYDFICRHSKNGFMKGDKCYTIDSDQESKPCDGEIGEIDISGKFHRSAYFHKEEDAKAWNEAMFKKNEPDFICYHSGNRFKIGDNSYKVSLLDGEIHQGEIHHVHKENLSGKETGLAHFNSIKDAQAWKEGFFGEADKERYEMYFINASFKVWVEVDLGENYHLKDKMIESGLVRVKKQKLI